MKETLRGEIDTAIDHYLSVRISYNRLKSFSFQNIPYPLYNTYTTNLVQGGI